MPKSLRLSLVAKIQILLIFYMLGILVIALVSNKDLRTAEKKLSFMALGYRLNNIILEIRRYEKNYLLYHTPEALAENNHYLSQALQVLTSHSQQASSLKVFQFLRELETQLRSYRQSMTLLTGVLAPHTKNYDQAVEKIREQGKAMTELSEHLVTFEEAQIHFILQELKRQLLLWSLFAALIGFIAPFFFSIKIFKPLGVIKKITEDIAKGRFKTIDILNTRDEIQQVMEAFNTMVAELEHRQDQLVQSKKLSSLGTLTAGIAHQLNNPLNNISTSCQIASEELDEGNRELLRGMLRNIDQETLRARDIVKGLLDFSRAREFSLQLTPLREVVHRAVQLVKSQVPVDILLSVDIPDDLLLPLDSQRMQEVFINLIINAAQAIDHEGSITITAIVKKKENQAVVHVRDTGPGIPSEHQGQIFDPFYTTKEDGLGTGLGLSIVYGIVQKHHGEIAVESAPGKGTCFLITLPLISNS